MLCATVSATIGAWPPAVKGTAGSVTNAPLQRCSKYDHYAVTEIGRPLWQDILKELDALATLLDAAPADNELSSQLGFFFRDTERKFFEKRTASISQVRQMVRELASWIRVQLEVQNSSVPAQVFQTVCLGCAHEVAVPMFLSSFYNFGTYRGPETGDFYRVDLDRLHYQRLDLNTLLRSVATEREGGLPLEQVPDNMGCPRCGVPIGLREADLRTVHPPQELSIEAVLL